MIEGGAFASYAFRMCELGLSPTPTLGPQGKTPLLKGYQKGIVNLGNVREFAANFPTANLALVCGPSRLVVLDIDEPSLLKPMIRRFGDSPLQVKTAGRGGFQLYYRSSKAILPCDLRATEGLEAEIKASGNIVVTPPSRHLETGRHYEIIEGAFDEDTLARLPQIAPDSLAVKAPSAIREGHREKWLFSQCLKHAPYCETYFELLDVAETRNDECVPPLPAKEVDHAAQSAWRYQLAGRNFVSCGGGVVLMRRDIDAICKLRPGDPLALVLRLHLEHAARCARGEDFALATAAMENADVITGWSRQNYRTAVGGALKYGCLKLINNCESPPRYHLA